MTIEETRKLGIEFERRVQTMIPDTQFGEKLDTETIYSFLNQYQDKYVHDIYRNLDSIQSGTNLKSHIDSVLQSLLKTVTVEITSKNKASGVVSQHMGSVNDSNDVPIVDTARSIRYAVPKDYYLYVRSVSQVGETYSFKASGDANTSGNLPIRIVPNQLVSQNDVWKLVETPHDSLRILRYPAAVMTEPVIVDDVIPDYMYTPIKKFVSGVSTSTYNGETISDDIYIKFDNGMWLRKKSDSNTYYEYHEVWNYSVTNNNINVPTLEDSYIEGYVYNESDGKYYLLNSDYGSSVELAIGLPTITVIYDQYTDPKGIKVTYYKEPSHFSLMTNTPCELPMDSFEELVSGAVDLYVQYVAGAEARKRQMEEARRQAAKEQEANNARRNRREE